MKFSIKGAVKKVRRENFGYYRSPALTTAGKRVLVWKAIWSCKRRKQLMRKIIRNNIDITGLSEKIISNLTVKQIRIELRKAVRTLK